jgi:hypothetical protein
MIVNDYFNQPTTIAFVRLPWTTSLADNVQTNLGIGKTLNRFAAFPGIAGGLIQGQKYVRGAALLHPDATLANSYGDVTAVDALTGNDLSKTADGIVQVDRSGTLHLVQRVSGGNVFRESGLVDAEENSEGYLESEHSMQESVERHVGMVSARIQRVLNLGMQIDDLPEQLISDRHSCLSLISCWKTGPADADAL